MNGQEFHLFGPDFSLLLLEKYTPRNRDKSPFFLRVVPALRAYF
jgi:hypothetical protein